MIVVPPRTTPLIYFQCGSRRTSVRRLGLPA
jgi:hypothetical protein